MNKNERLTKILLITLLALMTLPLVCHFVPSSKGPALFGINTEEFSWSQFTLNKMRSHKTQDLLESQAKQSVGFCNHAVRFHNELNYRLFHYSSAPKLILGRDDYFYENIYIDEYTGKDFVGTRTIRDNVQQLKTAQALLEQKGIHLLLVIEPSKAWHLPEHLPSAYHRGENTNYETYRTELQKQQVDFLDLNRIFIERKSSTKYPLYSKHGIHWSTYGMWIAADTLQHFIERQAHLTLPKIKHVGDSISSFNKDLDYDLEPPMNLMRELPHEKLCFPIMDFEKSNSKKARALFIADSYVWSLWDHGVLHHWFDYPQFWYYYNTVYPNIWGPNADLVDKEKVADTVFQQDVIVLMITTANLKDFGWTSINDFLYICGRK